MKAGVALLDVVTGLQAAIGTLAALQERERTGRGRHVSVLVRRQRRGDGEPGGEYSDRQDRTGGTGHRAHNIVPAAKRSRRWIARSSSRRRQRPVVPADVRGHGPPGVDRRPPVRREPGSGHPGRPDRVARRGVRGRGRRRVAGGARGGGRAVFPDPHDGRGVRLPERGPRRRGQRSRPWGIAAARDKPAPLRRRAAPDRRPPPARKPTPTRRSGEFDAATARAARLSNDWGGSAGASGRSPAILEAAPESPWGFPAGALRSSRRAIDRRGAIGATQTTLGARGPG